MSRSTSMSRAEGGEDGVQPLWAQSHPYYCAERAYSSPGHVTRYRSWAEFLEEWQEADDDMNLVFRWDWFEGGDREGRPFSGDVNYRNGLLRIFFMGQRKGFFWSHEVDVCRADEPAVREYLSAKADHLCRLWSPFLAPALRPQHTEEKTS